MRHEPNTTDSVSVVFGLEKSSFKIIDNKIAVTPDS